MGFVWLTGWDSAVGVELVVAGGGAVVWVADVRRAADAGQNRENNDLRSAMNVRKQQCKEKREWLFLCS